MLRFGHTKKVLCEKCLEKHPEAKRLGAPYGPAICEECGKSGEEVAEETLGAS